MIATSLNDDGSVDEYEVEVFATEAEAQAAIAAARAVPSSLEGDAT